MKDVALMYMNVVSSSFESVRTVLSTIETLDNFYILATRERIKAFVERKGVEVYNIFQQQIQNVKRECEHLRKKPVLPIVQGHPNFAGAALWAKGLMRRVSRRWEDLEEVRGHRGPLRRRLLPDRRARPGGRSMSDEGRPEGTYPSAEDYPPKEAYPLEEAYPLKMGNALKNMHRKKIISVRCRTGGV